MRVALYQPDIAQNTGAIMRLCACLNVPLEIIEPAGFDVSDRAIKRVALDYLPHVSVTRHDSFQSFERWRHEMGLRLVLLTTRGETPYFQLTYTPSDILTLGRESAGVPEYVHNVACRRVRVPIRPELRSLNIAAAAAMVLGEAMRQTGGFPSA